MNERVFTFFDTHPDGADWLDWRWQYRNRITDIETLSKIVSLGPEDIQGINASFHSFRMAVTPYFASLMDPKDPACPIRRQGVPSGEEIVVQPYEKKDPLNEDQDSPVSQLIHRYPDRALFLVSRQCAMYCRHCIRKTHVGEESFQIAEKEKSDALAYIKDTPRIRDVLISGGDPLVLADDQLEEIIARLREIDHVEIIRIGTRMPSTLPMRITPQLVSMLRKYHPIWINTQFNHPRELTPQALLACSAIVDAGIPLGNQSVLLRGINDDPAIMKDLLLGLVKARIRPYYLYQCDLCEGVEHFRTRVETGIELMNSLIGNITGFAIPQYVIDAPEGGGKIPINPDFLISIDSQRVLMRNYKGDLYSYTQAQHPL